MNILYIAFSCQPFKGSEEKIGWGIPLESSKHHNVFVVTREEQRAKIEEYVNKHKPNNIQFFYVDINSIYKKIFRGPLLSLKLKLLHKYAQPLVKEICKRENIDIIHQITPVEFRSIGDYADIENTKFVCGPLGGGEYIPCGLESYAKGHMFIEKTRRFLNNRAKVKLKKNQKLKKCDYIMFANCETKNYLGDLINQNRSSLFSEIGICNDEICAKDKQINSEKPFTILVAGRLNYRKGHSFLLDALNNIPSDIDYSCRFVGEGKEYKPLVYKCKEYKLENKVVFTGRITYEQMEQEYKNADVLVVPSLRETTGTVILEAMAHSVPVISADNFGAHILLDTDYAWFFKGKSKNENIDSLKNALLECMSNREKTLHKGFVANQKAYLHTFEKKVEYYNDIYNSI